MGVQVLTPGIKPAPTNISAVRVGREWDWVQERPPLIELPLWEAGGTLVRDLRGYSDGTLAADAFWSTTRVGLGVEADGDTTAYINGTGHQLTTFAHEVIYIPTVTGQSRPIATIAEAPADNTKDRSLGQDGGTDVIEWYIFDGSGQKISSTTTVEVGVPLHIFATADGSSMRLYIDGVEEASDVTVGSAFTGYSSPEYVLLRGDGDDGQRVGAGIVALFRVWDYVPTSEQIRQLALDPFGPFRPTRRTIVQGAEATTLTADAGSYAISGSAADLERALLMSGDAGSYSLSGAAADLERSLLMSGDAGSYSVSGSAADLLRALLMSGDAGSYSLTGANADLLRALLMSGDAGSYSVSGAAATLSRAIILTADAGSYAISGNAADLLRALILTGDAGSYSLSGAAATLIVTGDVTMTADAGSYSVSGSAADLLRSLLMSADAGGYTVTGSTADLIRALVMNANAGVYQVTGSTADLLRDLLMDAEAGAFVISGQDATLTATGAEVDLQPPFTAVWIDPERGSVWIAVARNADWTDPTREADWE